jgi:hypothetical protein
MTLETASDYKAATAALSTTRYRTDRVAVVASVVFLVGSILGFVMLGRVWAVLAMSGLTLLQITVMSTASYLLNTRHRTLISITNNF